MTICAAAICRHGAERMVIGIADRQYTRGRDDSRFVHQSNVPKAHFFHPRVIGLSAGDSDYAHEMATLTERQTQEVDIISVGAVANLHSANHAQVRSRLAESHVLSPLGLTGETFLSRQHELLPEVATSLTVAMQGDQWNLGTEMLVFGVDSTGPHIYHVTDPGHALCRERPGFLAIGTGAHLFDTVMGEAHYDANWPFRLALLLVYSAKRHSEMDPHVGTTTDIFIVRESGWRMLSPHEMYHIDLEHGSLLYNVQVVRNEAAESLANRLPSLP